MILRRVVWGSMVALSVLIGTLAPASAQVARSGGGALDKLTTVKPALQVAPRHVAAEALQDGSGGASLASFRALEAARPEASWRMTFDAATGRAAMLEGSLPWVSGAANSSAAAGAALKDVPTRTMIDKALAFLKENPDLFGVDPNDLRPMDGATGPIGDSAYFVDFRWTWKGIEVEKAHVVFRVNHGNLVQVGQEYVGPAIEKLDATPALSADDAWAALWSYVGGKTARDRIVAPARLLIVPVADGETIGYELVYAMSFARDGERGTWEARVDAHDGEIASFRDADVYGSVHGKAFATDQPSAELDRPFAFADVGRDGDGTMLYADLNGRFDGDAATSYLAGRRASIYDNCGSIGLSTTAGNLDFGGTPGTDCASSGVGGAGNTRAARTQYYNVNKIKQKALTYLPSNSWLAAQLTINVNVNDTCNAGWSPSTGTLNFFKSGGGCANTGELPGVSLHEFGHGLDTNDGDGFSPDNGTGETYGDFTAALQTHASCMGSGFYLSGVCGGYGDACKTCSGVRDVDYAKRRSNAPVTPAMLSGTTGFHCPLKASYAGPCGYEGHCESYIGTEALWDLANRDLPGAGLDAASAWQLVDRLWYTSRPTATAAYACTTGAGGISANGCGAGSLYSVLRAMDDDDGNLANGTPHAAAIYAALARHGIACGAASDTTNRNHAGCTLPGKPAATATVGDGRVDLAWGAVVGAQSYRILRNEDGCEMGYTKIADVAGAASAAYADGTPLNDLRYYYRVQALGGSDACAGPVSDCVPAMAVPSAATLRIGRTYVNCAASAVKVTLEDADFVGAGSREISLFSSADGAPMSLALTETGAGTGVFEGTFATKAGGTSQDGVVAVADGGTVTARYEDAAPTARTVDATASIDCTPPRVTSVSAGSTTDKALTIDWYTSEPTLTELRWGAAAPPTNDLSTAADFATNHAATISGLAACTPYVYDLVLEDRAGNVAVETNGGAHYSASTIGRTYALRDDVEGGVGSWTAAAASGSGFAISTCRAHSGANSWKIGTAACGGSGYQAVDASLTSAPFDLGYLGHGMHLRFWQWVATLYPNDKSYIQITTDGGRTWSDLHAAYSGTSSGWILWDIDLADYTGTAQLRFRFTSGGAPSNEGWYLDDIEVSALGACRAALKRSGTTLADACHGTGAAADGAADPGEHVRLRMSLANAGSKTATKVSAALATTDARAAVTNGAAMFPDVAGGGSGSSLEPQFAVRVGSSAVCGDQIPFTLSIASSEGAWSEQYLLPVGRYVVSGTAKSLDEHFDFPSGASSTWLPTGWTVAHTGTLTDWNVLTGFTKTDCTGNGKSSATHAATNTTSDSWIFGKATTLKAGTPYTLSFNLKAVSGSVTVEAALATAATTSSTKTTLWSASSFNGTACTAESVSFTVPSDGTYYLGFHDKTPASGGTVAVDDVVVSTPTYACQIHACTGGALAAPGETSGGADASLQWSGSTKDTLTWSGNAAATNGYRLYRGAAADLRHADGAVQNACVRWSGTTTTTGPTLTDSPAAGQVQWFLISGLNDAGEGLAATGWKINAAGACR